MKLKKATVFILYLIFPIFMLVMMTPVIAQEAADVSGSPSKSMIDPKVSDLIEKMGNRICP